MYASESLQHILVPTTSAWFRRIVWSWLWQCQGESGAREPGMLAACCILKASRKYSGRYANSPVRALPSDQRSIAKLSSTYTSGEQGTYEIQQVSHFTGTHMHITSATAGPYPLVPILVSPASHFESRKHEKLELELGYPVYRSGRHHTQWQCWRCVPSMY